MIIAACYNLRDIKNVKPSSWLAELIGLSILVASADGMLYFQHTIDYIHVLILLFF